MGYKLTSRASEDLINIYIEGIRMFGVSQAEKYQDGLEERFELLAFNPRMSRERLELVPPVRINPFGSHVVVYQIEEDDSVLIIRIRHGHEDWINNPVG